MPRGLRNDSLQGTLDLLVLNTLAGGTPLHGYAIATHIRQISDDVLRIEEGSLYPALHRIEGLGWISSEWVLSSTNRRVKVYSLTKEGTRQLEAEQQHWAELTQAVAKVLQCCGA